MHPIKHYKRQKFKNVIETEEIKKRQQEYTQLQKKSIHDHGNDDVDTHVEPDILECEVKRALAKLTTNKASGGDEISLELIKILKDVAVQVLHLMYQQI